MRFFLFSVFLSNLSFAQPIFDRASWTTWQGKWEGDLWNPGNFGNSIYMTCVGTDGSDGSPEFWANGMGDDAASVAYMGLT
jgi:hypothetical protein